MVEWSIEAFRACEQVRSIVVAAPPGHVHEFGGTAPGVPGNPEVGVVAGGATRSRSVTNAMAAVATELVAIHDAARPLLTPALVESLLATLDSDPEAAAAIPAAPITDTVKQARPGPNPELVVERTLDRSLLWGAQTPQLFRTEALRAALAVDEASRDAATDEAMLVEAAGGRVLIAPAPPENLKVTTPHDLRVAELLLAERAG